MVSHREEQREVKPEAKQQHAPQEASHAPHCPFDPLEANRPTTNGNELSKEEQLEEALLDSFPASDPPSVGR